MGVAKVQNINKTSPIGHDNRFLFGAQLPASTHKLQNQLPTCRHCERDYARPNVAFFDDDLGSNARSCLDSTWTCHDISKKNMTTLAPFFGCSVLNRTLKTTAARVRLNFPGPSTPSTSSRNVPASPLGSSPGGSSGGSAGDRVRL